MAWARHRQFCRLLDLAAGAAPAKLRKSRTETPTAIVIAARRLNRAAGTIAISVLIDSATLLAEQGFSVIGFDAGAYFRPLEDFASDETEQNKLYWNDARVVDGANPIQMGGKNSGKAVGGSTVHYAMVLLRFRPQWFKSRTTLGYGADWPISWQELWHYYAEAERQINISGPLRDRTAITTANRSVRVQAISQLLEKWRNSILRGSRSG